MKDGCMGCLLAIPVILVVTWIVNKPIFWLLMH